MHQVHLVLTSALAIILISLISYCTIQKGESTKLIFREDSRSSVIHEEVDVTVSYPEGMMFVASGRGKYYYPVLSEKGQELSPKYRMYFRTEADAHAAGFLHWR